MEERDPGRDDQLRSETWKGLYEFFMAEHERRVEALTELGVSPGDLKALMRLVPDRGEPMRALAGMWRCDASTVTWIVDRLEKQGLVERQAHQTDRRVKVVVLSPRGKQLRTRLLDDFYQPPAILSELSGADLEALHRLSTRLRPD
ncbi:MarR family winged helix-turn-helix transcriptional regulator [Streptosporangium lutulentum]|uniref:DNA-binding MarR family transcriptional regulator n=1 Tax=Streptosporangium lutulentum TaxID=1461250 RepID=A0ABT9QF94_9ACTN|nr:MarR family transcriptional regulator [Streptosporangium lutulentum]MDP9844968.1 DNA-binding MarR family transcriptional regulator [Streptosporangium lutulentum]